MHHRITGEPLGSKLNQGLNLAESLSQLKSSNQEFHSHPCSVIVLTWIPVSSSTQTEPFFSEIKPTTSYFSPRKTRNPLITFFKYLQSPGRLLFHLHLASISLAEETQLLQPVLLIPKEIKLPERVPSEHKAPLSEEPWNFLSGSFSAGCFFPHQHKVHREEYGISIQLLLVSHQPEECGLWGGFGEVLGVLGWYPNWILLPDTGGYHRTLHQPQLWDLPRELPAKCWGDF